VTHAVHAGTAKRGVRVPGQAVALGKAEGRVRETAIGETGAMHAVRGRVVLNRSQR
jgi:hypothetical protein